MDGSKPSSSWVHRHHKSIVRRRNLTQQAIRHGTLAAVLGAMHTFSSESDPAVKLRRKRNRNHGQCTWVHDYLSDNAMYTRKQFRQLFRVPRRMFERLHDDLVRLDSDRWATRFNAARQPGIDSRVKVLVSLKVLGSGRGNHDRYEGAHIGVETARIYFRTFCQHVIEMYGPQYLNRRPGPDELSQIERGYSMSGLRGCIGVVDCCRIAWKNCPFAHKQKVKTLRVAHFKVEVWCDRDLYIWNWFASRHVNDPRSNLMSDSPLFQDIFKASFPMRLQQSYTVTADSPERQTPYFVVSDKYPDWPIFAKPSPCAVIDNLSGFAEQHEKLQGDMKRTIGVLKNRFRFMHRDCFLWYMDDIMRAFKTCIILHNMLIHMAHEGEFFEDEMELGEGVNIITELYDEEGPQDFSVVNEMGYVTHGASDPDSEVEVDDDGPLNEADVMLTSAAAFHSLQQDLITAFVDPQAHFDTLRDQPSSPR